MESLLGMKSAMTVTKSVETVVRNIVPLKAAPSATGNPASARTPAEMAWWIPERSATTGTMQIMMVALETVERWIFAGTVWAVRAPVPCAASGKARAEKDGGISSVAKG